MPEGKFEQLIELLKVLNDVATNPQNFVENRMKARKVMDETMNKLDKWVKES